jgi:hypothetical protein
MGDNRHSTILLACTRCGQKYQAVAQGVRTCLCGGELKPVEKREMPRG